MNLNIISQHWTSGVHVPADNAGMRYKIPSGTRVDVKRDGKVRQHTTRIDLEFEEIAATEHQGQVLYFRHGEFEIGVNKRYVKKSTRPGT